MEKNELIKAIVNRISELEPMFIHALEHADFFEFKDDNKTIDIESIAKEKISNYLLFNKVVEDEDVKKAFSEILEKNSVAGGTYENFIYYSDNEHFAKLWVNDFADYCTDNDSVFLFAKAAKSGNFLNYIACAIIEEAVNLLCRNFLN